MFPERSRRNANLKRVIPCRSSYLAGRITGLTGSNLNDQQPVLIIAIGVCSYNCFFVVRKESLIRCQGFSARATSHRNNPIGINCYCHTRRTRRISPGWVGFAGNGHCSISGDSAVSVGPSWVCTGTQLMKNPRLALDIGSAVGGSGYHFLGNEQLRTS